MRRSSFPLSQSNTLNSGLSFSGIDRRFGDRGVDVVERFRNHDSEGKTSCARTNT